MRRDAARTAAEVGDTASTGGPHTLREDAEDRAVPEVACELGLEQAGVVVGHGVVGGPDLGHVGGFVHA